MVKYQELWNEENTNIRERYDLAMERILEIPSEERVAEPYRSYFNQMAAFTAQIEELARLQLREDLDAFTLEELQQLNDRLYADILPEHYTESYANPAYAVRMLGADLGPLLSAFYAQFRAAIVFAYECRLTDITILCETLIEIYNMFEDSEPQARAVRDVLYWFFSDYTDVTLTYRIREQLDPGLSFAKDIIMESDLSDLRYLYRFGEYISDSELQIASYLKSLPEETIEKMASTYTEGYRKGFDVMGRDLSKKKTVSIRYELGFERMIRAAIRQFEEMGLEVILYRAAVWSVTMSPNRKIGYHGTSANMQFDYDHRYDQTIYLDKAFKERKLAVLRTAYENCKKLAAEYAGPAVVETFGEDGFEPVNKPEAYSLSEKQEELQIAYSNEAMPVVNQYIPGDETSFTIIAFPVPAIGKDFAEIFHETIRINTLDYEEYKKIQQNVVDVLDQAEYVTVTGNAEAGNETRMKISLHALTDPAKQTNFENCVADVNIPVGEVFTSPVLAGTEGLLHVSQVYIGDFQFKNFRMEFKDGKITNYSCDNFADPEEGKKLIRQQILKNHDTLPMGEFAIGTNTTAYAVARKYGIMDKFPILIAEKTGPHFAVGDTCYSWSEDSAVYNPDGKEIIARDNEISLLRKEDVSKAYFGCHTDITIPYSELGDIAAVCGDGRKLPLIQNGRFVVAGTEKLNEELDG
ncbi:MAG: aminopeptidase [Clostridium sp.]|jgi:aminopeptidase|uniref:aminopeptidase n=1 Tax=Clostridium sp. AF27-2AA TaxID=2292206 RepID=UPI000E555194|nr:aminopeptidase [Clostridium sp. AF27-2AA]RHQ29226.1 leucyl aminopeptidase [Clostridium sp. AF27-2AA]